MARDVSRLPASAASDELRNSLAHRKILDPQPAPAADENKGNYIASLSCVAAWLGSIAEAAQFLLFPSPNAEDAQGGSARKAGASIPAWLSVRGPPFSLKTRTGRCRGRQWIYDLRHGKAAQSYEIGIKEVRRVEEGKYVPGKLHTLGHAHQR
ncbi:hypothetical protein K438DRAFT_1944898 [Mycena galopus ATCC 62051]|nr:hypothetical protein K438DRAFT_1944898 [Mycena galopus ATCC 62051]